jgi:hypothetical protein
MKKISYLVFLGALLFGSTVYAQTTDQATLQITLQQVQSITVNAAQKIVTLTYASANDYQNGVSEAESDHLSIDSNADFDVQVNASGDLTDGSSNTLAANTITLLASDGSTGTASGTTPFPSVTLSTTKQALINKGDAGFGKTFNVDYTAAGNGTYLNKPLGTYSTTITYTLTAH